MIPLTENTITAVAALIYNCAYEQDPDTGWLADDEHSAPAHELQWLEWSARLLQALQEHPEADDEQILSEAKRRVDIRKVGHDWDTIPMDQDHYSTISHETDAIMNIIRDFLEHPCNYSEVRFIDADPRYLAYLEEWEGQRA